MKNYFVRDIMSVDPITVSEHDTLYSVKQIFDNKNIHHIPVVDNGELKGIISSGDFERSKQAKTMFINHDVDQQNETILQVTLVGMVMTEKVLTISADDSLFEAYQVFKNNSFRSLPVMQGNQLVGIITPMDFLDFYFNKN